MLGLWKAGHTEKSFPIAKSHFLADKCWIDSKTAYLVRILEDISMVRGVLCLWVLTAGSDKHPLC